MVTELVGVPGILMVSIPSRAKSEMPQKIATNRIITRRGDKIEDIVFILA